MPNQITTKPVRQHIYAIRNKRTGLYIAQYTNAIEAQKFVDDNAPLYEIVE